MTLLSGKSLIWFAISRLISNSSSVMPSEMKIPEIFFTQGTAGRIHWNYVQPKPTKPKEEQPDWNDLTKYDESEENLGKIKNKLYKLEATLQRQGVPIIVFIDDV